MDKDAKARKQMKKLWYSVPSKSEGEMTNKNKL